MKEDFERIARLIAHLEAKHGKYAAMNSENEIELRDLSALRAEANKIAGIKVY